MDYVFLIVSGVVIGLIVAVPIGPVNLICIRRTLAFGPVNGFVSGLGAALGDTLFAIVTGFGLTAAAQLIKGYSSLLELIGGGMLILAAAALYGLWRWHHARSAGHVAAVAAAAPPAGH